jgi:hypothetical protein
MKVTPTYEKISNPVFQQVCNRILAKECIPFLGSGVSDECQYLDDISTDFKGHKVKSLKSALSTESADKPSLGKCCDEFLFKQNGKKLHEALEALVNKLQIKEFTKLKPTTAHYCIALLAREGLLPQIFTTNYDTALERAFIESFGVKWKNNEDEHLSVIHDQVSCINQRSGKQGSGEVLHLYKINGCADALSPENNYHSKILLTTTQLQSWRDRRWAKDTFQVALRSNTMLFSGFGSDEPQVIHTIHQILDEYSSFSCKNHLTPDINDLQPNAPVIHSFESELSFCHLQIVNNYTQSIYEKYDRNFAHQLILTMKNLTPNSSEENLRANCFWFWVLQEIQFQLVLKIISKAIEGQLAISALPDSRFVFEGIKSEWESESSKFQLLLSYDRKISNWQTLLSNYLSQLLANGTSYEPLNSHWNIVAEFLWLLWSTQAKLDTIKVLEDPHNGNILELEEDKGQVFMILAKRQNGGHYSSNNSSSAVIIPAFCLTANFSTNFSLYKEIRLIKGNKTRKMIRAYIFSLTDLYNVMWPIAEKSGKYNHKEMIQNVLSSPSKWQAKLRPKKKQRYTKESKL